MELPSKRPEKIRLTEINPYLTCYLCKGYLIDATTISECLHSFCRCCIIKFVKKYRHCPVCELVINTAKPNLKLDKTLQDVVYKLVPELFLKEMTRRRLFYQQHPEISARVSPEERGEDTERTIFNPKDLISLSIEYISDDSSSRAILILASTNGCDNRQTTSEDNAEAQMKRYLQCAGMCRVELLKKFIQNKYNVDINLFYIEILYKRVPLPDHYTLIDIAYIYSWKRNEPMKFYFRITDVNKVSERFDYIGHSQTDMSLQTVRTSRNNGTSGEKTAKKRDSMGHKKLKEEPSQDTKSEVVKTCDKINEKSDIKVAAEVNNIIVPANSVKVKKAPAKEVSENKKKTSAALVQSENSESILLKPEIKEEIKNKIKNDKNEVYTNITLNRSNNEEIVTKIQKVSNKDGQPIGLNIKQVKKNPVKTRAILVKKLSPNKPVQKTAVEAIQSSDVLEDEKSRFLKSIELTAKTVVENIVAKHKGSDGPLVACGQKRKATSPIKIDKPAKKGRVDKKPTTKIIIQTKQPTNASIKAKESPTDSLLKSLNNREPQKMDNGLQSLIDSCKINIPSSLSITIKESNESAQSPMLIPPVQNYIEILKLPDEKTDDNSTSNKDVQQNKLLSEMSNYDSEQKVDQDLSEIAKSLTEKMPKSTSVSHITGPKLPFPIPNKPSSPPKFSIQPAPVPDVPCKILNMPKDSLIKLNPRSPQTFQKIFEESIKTPKDEKKDEQQQKSALDLSSETSSTGGNNKRNILEIASQLYKKTKLEQEKNLNENTKKEEVPAPKVAIPRLPNKRTMKPPQKSVVPMDTTEGKFPQTVANLHSSSLGLNYTVSVGQNTVNSPPKANGVIDNEIKCGSPPKSTSSPIKIPTPSDKNNTKLQSSSKPSDFLSVPPSFVPFSKQSELRLDLSGLSGDSHKSPKLINKNHLSPGHSPKLSPKSSPVVKHMFAPTTPPIVDHLRTGQPYRQKIPSPKLSASFPNKQGSPSPKSPKISTTNLKPTASPKAANSKVTVSPKATNSKITSPKVTSPKNPSSKGGTASKPGSSQSSPLNSNQLLEKYNIQNLAQLTANLNFNTASFGLAPGNQIAALQQAVLMKHFELQNRQNWLSMNHAASTIQYEKFLQSLGSNQNHLLGNIKEN